MNTPHSDAMQPHHFDHDGGMVVGSCKGRWKSPSDGLSSEPKRINTFKNPAVEEAKQSIEHTFNYPDKKALQLLLPLDTFQQSMVDLDKWYKGEKEKLHEQRAHEPPQIQKLLHIKLHNEYVDRYHAIAKGTSQSFDS